MKKRQKDTELITANTTASRNYFIEDRLEAGIVLQGWEVKSLRDKRLNLKDCHARLHNGEIWLLGAHISPLPTCIQIGQIQDPVKSRKLLLKRHEIRQLTGAINQRGYTLVATKAYWKNNRVKVELALAKGKHAHDKRADEKRQDWEKEKRKLLKNKLS